VAAAAPPGPSTAIGNNEASGATAPWTLAITSARENTASIVTSTPADPRTARRSARRKAFQRTTPSTTSTASRAAAITALTT
jgi:hypothetical protein